MTAAALLLFSYVFLIYIAFFTPMGSVFLLIPLLSIPLALKTIMLMRKGNTPVELIPAMASMGKLNTIMGLLLTIGLIIYGMTGI